MLLSREKCFELYDIPKEHLLVAANLEQRSY